MANNLKDSQASVVIGLGTWVHTTEFQSLYSVSAACTDVPPSGLTITINQNGSPKATTTILAATQQVLNLQASLACLAADVISIVLSSAQLDDQASLNKLKTTITVRRGN